MECVCTIIDRTPHDFSFLFSVIFLFNRVKLATAACKVEATAEDD